MTSSKAAARAAVRKLVKEMGMGFHPDTPMKEYVDDNRRLIFSAREAARHQAVLDRAHAVLGDEVYTVALDAMEPARQKILAGMRSRRNPKVFPPNAITDPMEMRFFLNQLETGDVVTFFYQKVSSDPIKSMTVEVEDTQSLSASFIVYLRKKGPMRPGQVGGPALEASKYSDAVMYAPSMASTRIPVLALSKGTATMIEDKAPTMRAARANPKATPRIYVANLAAYNAGRLKGKWIEPSTDADELAEQVAEAIGGNVNRDEWAFHDYAGFPNMGENPSLKAVAEMAELLEEHPYAVVKAASDAGFVRRNDVDALRKWLDEGYGVYESKRDYVEQMVDDMGGPSALGKQAINSYFDYEAFGRTVAMEAEEEESERLEGMSDSEIGESVIDELYGDKIPKDLADDYFDYDAYARDVFMEVASVRTPEGLLVFNAR